MSFTLRSISVYSHTGECRSVTFRKSGLNIVTGWAKTGKSSLIDILDYCFGRSECYIAAGVIRQHVSWFAVEIENDDDVLSIARRNPAAGRRTSPDIHIRRGDHNGPPAFADLHKNTTEDALIRLITRFAGISENEHRPLTGTRRPLQATIRHALFLCFQKQDEIASRERLFHRQGDEHIPLAIKDTIPYFLGAVDENYFLLRDELDKAKLSLSELQARRDALKVHDDRAHTQIRRFLVDARRVGLMDHDYEPTDTQLALRELSRVADMEFQSSSIVSGASETIVRLENELRTLHRQLDDVQNDIRATNHFIREQTNYSREVGEQRVRLMSLGLYTGASDADDTCPLCETQLNSPTPSAADLASSLRVLDQQLQAVGAERPHLQERLKTFADKRLDIEQSIVATQRALERAYADDERAKRQRDEALERARVVGRIGAFLEQFGLPDERADLDTLIEEAQRRVITLAEHIDAEDVEERVYTFLNLIADYMTEDAAKLDLEHAEGRIRLDLKRLSIVAETAKGPIHLSQIGSGENWVGYHVIALLALHRWFREQDRPVPGLLVFDQPSQAHYPAEAAPSGSIALLEDADRRAVHSLFEFLHSATQTIGDGFQLLVLDHAHLDDDWFNAAIVEEWRGGPALVPIEWMKST